MPFNAFVRRDSLNAYRSREKLENKYNAGMQLLAAGMQKISRVAFHGGR